MASKTVKFEVELRGLRVKFEGDIQIAERFSAEIAGAINNLASAQQKLFPAPQRQAAPQPAQIESGRRGGRRRKRSAAGGSGIDPAIIGGTTVPSNGDGEGDAEGAEGRRRRSGGGGTTLLTVLKDEGFFNSKRTIGDICGALGKKGHTYKSNEISPTLVSLTQQEILKREKDQKNQWVYFT